MKRITLVVCCAMTMLMASAQAYDMETVWKAYDAFNEHLLDSKKGIYKTNTKFEHATDRFNGAAAIWCQPMYLDMAMDAMNLAKKVGDKKRAKEYEKLALKIYKGNKKQYEGFNTHDNNENTGWFIYDDIQWWTITLARAYAQFGKKEMLKYSEEAFSRVWYGSKKVGDTGSYDREAGGMFWQWQPIKNPKPNRSWHGKMACINFPTVVACMELYKVVPENRKPSSDEVPLYQTREQYLAKAKEIYAWAVDHLFNSETGLVADHIHGDRPNWKGHVYNQATFIGASAMLYQVTGEKHYLDNAIKATDYVVNVMSARHGVLPFERGIEQGIYTAIFAEYVDILVHDLGQTQYLPFLQNTINVGWSNRDKTRNITGGYYARRMREGSNVDSYSASGIPALMLVFPPQK